jgi:[acyl-carrier-protein] S-malonyltransferase
MGRDLAAAFPEARAVYDRADAALAPFQLSISRVSFEGTEEELKLTAVTQPAILVHSVAVFEVLKARGLSPSFLAGHSLGEWSALVAVGALTLEDAVVLVHRRGTFMQEAVPAGKGAMSAVLGLDPARVKEICLAVARETGEVVSPANYNEPAQTVIAGAAGAVERAGAKLKEAGAKRVLPLPVSAPFHCALMEPVKGRLEPVLRAIRWSAPRVPVVTNVEARPNADAARIVPLLVEQVTSPVRWIECIEELVRQGVTRLVEVGPGKVLSGLAKRVDRSLEVWNVEDRASLEKTVAALRS